MTRDDSKHYENMLVGILFFSWGTVFLDRMLQLYLAPLRRGTVSRCPCGSRPAGPVWCSL